MDFNIIKTTAKRRGTNIKELMVKIDMSEANFYKCVKRNSMESKYIEAIAKALNVPVSCFFNEKPNTSIDWLCLEDKNLTVFNLQTLKTLVKRNKLTHKELGNALNVSDRTVLNYLTGKTKIDVDTISKLSDVLDVPVSYFFNEQPIESNSSAATKIEQLERSNRKKDFIINTFRMFFYNQNPELSKVVEKSMEELKDEDF